MKLKNIALFFLIVAVIFPLSGCSQQKLAQKDMLNTKWASSQKNFPDYLVGVWEAEVLSELESGINIRWGIKFEPDGSISKINQPIAGEVNVPEGGSYLEGPDKGTFAYFILGPCEADYNAKTRVLKAHIVVDEYMMKLPTGDLQGKLESFLEGPVSKDGETWQANWYDFAWLDGADALDTNSIWEHPVKMVFKKQHFKEQDLKKQDLKE